MNAPPKEAWVLAASIRWEPGARKHENSIVKGALKEGHRIIVCPPYISIAEVAAELQGSGIAVGAQNCHHELKGAYTGEISASMVAALGCTWTIAGHSERRRDQQESDEIIGKKCSTALTVGMRTILCVGETLEQREAGETMNVIQRQLDGILASCGKLVFDVSVLAYEPVWAIGTGQTATPEQISEVHIGIREHLRRKHTTDIPILYGGSVTPENAEEIFRVQHVNGALVGGASLKSESFLPIIEAARRAANA